MVADSDKKTLSPGEQMPAAIRGESVEVTAGEPGPETSSADNAQTTHARTPTIDRRDEAGSISTGPRGNPFAVAPPILGMADSGAGMGFEFKTRRNNR